MMGDCARSPDKARPERAFAFLGVPMRFDLERWNRQREAAIRMQMRVKPKPANDARSRAKKALVAALIAASAVAAEGNPVVRVPAPTTYSDGTALPAEKRHAAQVYCGRERGKYVQAWAVISSADTVDVPLNGLRTTAFCAATYVAQAPGTTDLRESDYSVEFTVAPITSAIPLTPTVIWAQPAVCTTTCTVNRTR